MRIIGIPIFRRVVRIAAILLYGIVLCGSIDGWYADREMPSVPHGRNEFRDLISNVHVSHRSRRAAAWRGLSSCR